MDISMSAGDATLKRAAPQTDDQAVHLMKPVSSGSTQDEIGAKRVRQNSGTENKLPTAKVISLPKEPYHGTGGIPPLTVARESHAQSSTSGSDEVYSITMLIPAKLAGSVLGVKGATIQALREKSGAKIHMRHPDDPIDRSVLCSGNWDEVKTAVCLVLSQVQSKDQDYAVNSVYPTLEDSHPVELKILVANNKVGGLIGKQGASIQEIRDKTSATISIPSNNSVPHGALDRSVAISGPLGEVLDALRQIVWKLKEVRPSRSDTTHHSLQKPARGMASHAQVPAHHVPASTYLSRGQPAMAAPPYNPTSRQASPVTAGYVAHAHAPHPLLQPSLNNTLIVSEKVSVESKYMGKIIGAKGRTVSEIRRQSKCQIDIENQNNSGIRVITLTGTLEQRELAKSMISNSMV